MNFDGIRTILDQEGSDFYQATYRWKPKDLIPEPYRRSILKNAQERLDMLEDAEAEFQKMDRAPVYMIALKRMRIAVRTANFAWRADDLKFLQSVSQFFSDFGTVLQNLRIDKARGRFDTPGMITPSSVGV